MAKYGMKMTPHFAATTGTQSVQNISNKSTQDQDREMRKGIVKHQQRHTIQTTKFQITQGGVGERER